MTVRTCLRVGIGIALLGASSLCAAFSIGFTPSTGAHSIGSPFSVNVVVSGLESDAQVLSTYDFDVDFDPARLQFVSALELPALCDQGPLLNIACVGGPTSLFLASPSAGAVNLFDLSGATDAQLALQQGDSFAIARLTFMGLASGSADLAIGTVNALGGVLDENGITTSLLALQPGFTGASFTIAPAAIPEPTSLALLGLALAALAAFRRRRS